MQHIPEPEETAHATVGQEAAGPSPVAADLPETADTLRRYRRNARYWINAGAAFSAAAASLVALASHNEDVAIALGPLLAGLGAAALGIGLHLHVRVRRMRRVLTAGPWTAHASAATQLGSSGAAVVIAGGPAGDELLALGPHTTQWRYHLVSKPGVLWWCGDPRTGGVLAPEGGGELIWARPPGARRARRILARPQVQNLVHRPAPDQPQPSSVPPTGALAPADRPKTAPDARPGSARPAPGYAVFAAEAERQAALRTPDASPPRPGTGVREMPWWRVRALRKTSGIAGAAYAVGYPLVVGVVIWARPGTLSGAIQILAAIVAVAGLFRIGRVLRHGIPRARRLARHATAPAPRVKRYALLYGKSGTAADPVLVLFPAGAEDGTAPEALLRLAQPGPARRPWSGLPAPTGTAALRGWLDGPPLAVAWIDGRPCWPLDEYEELDLSAPATTEALEDLLTARA